MNEQDPFRLSPLRSLLSAICYSPGGPRPFSQGSGRLELADQIASPSNPLTARVIVNRVWMHHFGAPLVETPSDFGVRSQPPMHRELLDYLAATFIDEGWSLKDLHRRILLSSTWRQASTVRAEAAAKDPENHLLWRMNRRRLEFEPARDAWLSVAGRLDTRMGGRPVDLWQDKSATRRTVYGLIDRQDLPDVLRNFDFANPDVSVAERSRTTVPQQALFVLNSPFMLEQVRHLASRPEVAGEPEPAARIQALYRLVFGRPATERELEAGLRFIAAGQPSQLDQESGFSCWEMYAHVLLSSNEFLFID